MTTSKPVCALLFASSFMLLACSSEPVAPKPASQVHADPQADAVAVAEPAAAPEDAPQIASDEATYDFGAIKPIDSIEHVFKIKNVGTADLHIDHVQKT